MPGNITSPNTKLSESEYLPASSTLLLSMYSAGHPIMSDDPGGTTIGSLSSRPALLDDDLATQTNGYKLYVHPGAHPNGARVLDLSAWID